MRFAADPDGSSGLSEPDEGVARFEVEIAMELPLGANDEEEDEQYERVRLALVQYEDAIDPPLRVTLTRRAPELLPADELVGVLSICRDAVIDVLGVASDHPGVDWQYRQAEGPHALIVDVCRREADG